MRFLHPGMIMTTYAFLRKNPDPSEEEIRVALAGNLCRCTGIFRFSAPFKRPRRRCASWAASGGAR